MDGVTLSLLGSVVIMQLYIIVSHEKRISRLEAKINLICQKIMGEKSES